MVLHQQTTNSPKDHSARLLSKQLNDGFLTDRYVSVYSHEGPISRFYYVAEVMELCLKAYKHPRHFY